MAASQIQGNTTANIAEVEATKALRVTLRPEDYGSLGIYAWGGSSGTMAVSLAAGAEIFQFRWGNASNLCLLKRVTISAACVAAFTAQAMALEMKRALSFSVNGTGGAASTTPTGNQNKLRTTGMGSTLVSDIRIATTAALGVGTETLDTNPVGAIAFGAQATAGAQLLAPFPIWEARPGEHPLVFAQNEGFVLRNVIGLPGAGTWTFSVGLMWSELASY